MTAIAAVRAKVRDDIAWFRLNGGHLDAAMIDPRTGKPCASWHRLEELQIGRELAGNTRPPDAVPAPRDANDISRHALAPWRRAAL